MNELIKALEVVAEWLRLALPIAPDIMQSVIIPANEAPAIFRNNTDAYRRITLQNPSTVLVLVKPDNTTIGFGYVLGQRETVDYVVKPGQTQ